MGIRIRFRKILPDGRSVRFEREEGDTQFLDLNVIVYRDPREAKGRSEDE
jgi:hypothetical protein